MRLAWALLVYASYWVRPYDMLADRRRWFWQKATRCGGVLYIHQSEDGDAEIDA